LIVIQGKDLAKSYGGLEVLKQVTFSVNAGDKVGVVGPNGAGKTTLFRCLSGEELADHGQVMIGSGLKLGMVEQEVNFQEDNTLEMEFMSAFSDLLELRGKIQQLTAEMEQAAAVPAELTQVMGRYQEALQQYEEQGGYAIENKMRQVAAGLRFNQEDLGRRTKEFSGGQQTRIKLGKLLLKQPDILLLDEPTNHLDLESSEWLESFLKGYPGTVLVISHDRYFLEQVSTKILELAHGRAKLYPGDYSAYKKLKAEQEQAYQKAYDKQQEYIKATEQFIDKYRAGIKSKQARGRQKQLDRLEQLDRPLSERALSEFSFAFTDISGERVLELSGIGFGYDRRHLFQHVHGLVRRGEKVALVGPNGCGKTTLLKVITGALKPNAGELRYGAKIKIAYYSQIHEDLFANNTVLGEIINNTDLDLKEARSYLGRFLFSQEDVFKRVGDLSGGEKSRLALLKLLLKGANFLVLDEPTNHLDIPAKEVLEQALKEFPGSVILVSHDRYFLDQVIDKVWEFGGTEKNMPGIVEYYGDYSYYRLKKEELLQQKGEMALKGWGKKLSAESEHSAGKTHYLGVKEAREKEKEEKRLKRQKDKALAELEEQIMMLEEEKEELSHALANPLNYEDGERMRELTKQFQKIDEELIILYEQWDLLAAESD
jgi:ATP-binding cassette subfamily F protein 3